MKILIGHNHYKQAGGEDAMFYSETSLLKDFGHEVCLYERHNDEIKSGIVSKIFHAAALRYSKHSYDQMRSLIRSFRPEVAHFHNTFFVMTPSVFYACKEEGVPVVVSLHNFRLMCLNGLLLREGKPCEDCLVHSRLPGIVHKCYRSSYVNSILAAGMTDYHWQRGTWKNTVDRLVVATEFTKNKHIQGGISPEKLTVVPPFMETPSHPPVMKSNYALYAGRLDQEKGVDVLLQAWRNLKEIPLYIVGTGPKHKEIENIIKTQGLTHVKMLGFLENKEYLKVLECAKFLVVPSVCYENFPRVVVEAYAYGVPVVANNLGTMPEAVQEGITGLLYATNDPEDLVRKARQIAGDENQYTALCKNTRRVYEEQYTPLKHYEKLMRIYEGVRHAS